MDLVKSGDFIVIQRQSYMKAHKLPVPDKKPALVALGRDSLDISAVVGHPYGSCFKMSMAENSSKKKRTFQLELTDSVEDFEEMLLDDENAGTDNRNIFDAAAFSKDIECSQKLTTEEIESMRDQGVEGSKIIEELIENSASFSQKTRFSQEKFVRKKSQKYYPYIMVRKPSIRILAHIYYNTDPMKIMNMRIDTLAQMLNMANVRAGANYVVYETGCQGLVVSAVMDRLISRVDDADAEDNAGRLVHIFQTGTPQTQALAAMNFPEGKVAKRLSSLNIYHLRSLENGVELFKRPDAIKAEAEEALLAAGDQEQKEGQNGSSAPEKPHHPHRQRLRDESTASYNLMKDRNMDGLLIACKQHPTNLLLSLMKYLAPSRPFVVYSPFIEPLMETYLAVKDTGKAVMVMLTETWLRNYQVLPDRTHPEVMMSGGGGYLLSGIVVDNSDPVGYESVSKNGDRGSAPKRHRRN